METETELGILHKTGRNLLYSLYAVSCFNQSAGLVFFSTHLTNLPFSFDSSSERKSGRSN